MADEQHAELLSAAEIEAMIHDMENRHYEPGRINTVTLQLKTMRSVMATLDAARAIVAAVAAIELVYQDDHLEYVCPGCKEFVSAAWERHAPPQYLTHQAWAEDRIKHAADCPIARARMLWPKGDDHDLG